MTQLLAAFLCGLSLCGSLLRCLSLCWSLLGYFLCCFLCNFASFLLRCHICHLLSFLNVENIFSRSMSLQRERRNADISIAVIFVSLQIYVTKHIELYTASSRKNIHRRSNITPRIDPCRVFFVGIHASVTHWISKIVMPVCPVNVNVFFNA